MPRVFSREALVAGALVRRSSRRRRTVSASLRDGRLVVDVPSTLTRAQEREWVDRMAQRVLSSRARTRPSDTDLLERARSLSRAHLGGAAAPTSVAWTDDQNTRWGSTTTLDGSIRLSSRLRDLPSWVVDHVLLHELVHLSEPGHGPRFRALLDPTPHAERARGYLEGYLAGAADGSAEVVPAPVGEGSLPPDG